MFIAAIHFRGNEFKLTFPKTAIAIYLGDKCTVTYRFEIPSSFNIVGQERRKLCHPPLTRDHTMLHCFSAKTLKPSAFSSFSQMAFASSSVPASNDKLGIEAPW